MKRVEYREEKYDEKMMQRKKLMLQRKEEEKLKEMRLSKLRLSVKRNLNEDNIAKIGGLHRETQSALHRKDGGENSRIDMFAHHGYSDEKLFDDPKFQLMNHLISNNLHASKYAKQCLKNTKSAARPRK